MNTKTMSIVSTLEQLSYLFGCFIYTQGIAWPWSPFKYIAAGLATFWRSPVLDRKDKKTNIILILNLILFLILQCGCNALPRIVPWGFQENVWQNMCRYVHLQALHGSSINTWEVGIAQWLEHGTHDRKVAGSNPCWSSGRIFFSRVNFLCWLLFWYPFHPRAIAVACKRPWSFRQKMHVAGNS